MNDDSICNECKSRFICPVAIEEYNLIERGITKLYVNMDGTLVIETRGEKGKYERTVLPSIEIKHYEHLLEVKK